MIREAKLDRDNSLPLLRFHFFGHTRYEPSMFRAEERRTAFLHLVSTTACRQQKLVDSLFAPYGGNYPARNFGSGGVLRYYPKDEA
jgi:hypothetical protein